LGTVVFAYIVNIRIAFFAYQSGVGYLTQCRSGFNHRDASCFVGRQNFRIDNGYFHKIALPVFGYNGKKLVLKKGFAFFHN
jgi:hypothetical protein